MCLFVVIKAKERQMNMGAARLRMVVDISMLNNVVVRFMAWSRVIFYYTII